MVAVPSVYVLVVNWNGRHHLEACLPSLFATCYPAFRVVLIDNGSDDGSLEWVQQHFPQVQTVALGVNRGFAAANNVGIRRAMAAGADYAVLLNNDTRVECTWLAALVEEGDRDPQAAICQARQRTWDGASEIRFRFVPEWAEAEAEYRPVVPAGVAVPSPFASGCALLMRCAALKQIGLFDERYFMYVEDVDLSLRAWIAGYRVLDVPAAVVYHRMTGSDSRQRQRMYWGYRNQLTTLLKLYQPETLWQFAEPISKRWLRTRNRMALHGTLAACAILPGTVARRRQVQQARCADDYAFLRWCLP